MSPAAARHRHAAPTGVASIRQPRGAVPIIRFAVRAVALVAIVLWTVLLAGALQSLLETGTALRSLEIELGQPELEAILYNLILRIEAAGPVGLLLAWLFGVVVILVVRRVLLALVGVIWDATSTWAPRRRAPARPPARPRPTPGAGPWARQTPAPPPAPAPPDSAPPPPHRSTAPARRPLVERTDGRRDVPPGEAGVVLQRPRGHMDGP